MPFARPGLLFLLVAMVYAGSLVNGFHFDDFHTIVNNHHIRELSSIPSFFRDAGAFSVNPESAMYRPLLSTTLAIDYAISGYNASGYHAVNMLIHGLTAIAAFSWLVGLGIRARESLTTALIFAVHPINSKAVCYISSRSELLMGLCMLCALTLHARHRDGNGEPLADRIAGRSSSESADKVGWHHRSAGCRRG